MSVEKLAEQYTQEQQKKLILYVFNRVKGFKEWHISKNFVFFKVEQTSFSIGPAANRPGPAFVIKAVGVNMAVNATEFDNNYKIVAHPAIETKDGAFSFPAPE